MNPMFEYLVMDDVIRKNPIKGVLKETGSHRFIESTRRTALSPFEQTKFMSYMKMSPIFNRYYNLLVTFLGTGGRAGEILGLTWNDINFDENYISINHSLSYLKGADNKHIFVCGETKTQTSVRIIPMFFEVRQALLDEKIKQAGNPCKCNIDGYSDFVFLNSKGFPYHPSHINRMLAHCVECLNNECKTSVRVFSMHNLRHTFATNLCMSETNLKVIQTIMGHSDIKVTMNIYAECHANSLHDAVKRLEGKIRIGVRDEDIDAINE